MASTSAFSGSVPANYETYLGPLFFEPYALDLVARIKGHPQQVLELACGTGRVTKHLMAKLGSGAKLVATDLNEAMLSTAKAIIHDERIEWRAADAQNLPFQNEGFDLIVCQYGVMFFPDKPKAFAEAARVLKRGGVYLFNTWDHLRHNHLSKHAQEVLEKLFPSNPPPFLTKGPYSYFNQKQIKQDLHGAGFSEIEIETVALTGTATTAEEAANGMIDGTPISGYLAEQNAPASAVKEELKTVLIDHYGGRNLQLPMQAFVCSATKDK